ncbi:MAG: type III toxin-antitoxin system CptIN family toxin [Clostridia bacterium]
MKIENGKFYFIKDDFFEKINDKTMLLNKDDGNKRPCYYCFRDCNNDDLIWFVPISSKVEKYKRIYEYKIEKFKRVDTIVFGKINGKERVFLIQNMFPIIEKYIQEKYIQNNKDVEITHSLRKEIEEKANYVLKLAERGKKVVFTDIVKIKKMLLEELKKL